ncbi:MAG: efflux RND transporter periplasmic adaptor subunit [Planctomycetota bacterium]|jgi:multidrug efflux pump subunit AcrA (membrane-fusion protein)
MRAVIILGLFVAVAVAQGMPPALVEVAAVEQKTVAAGRTFVGTIRPFRESVVGAEVAGRIAEMLVRDGDRVKADQPLARLKSRVIEVRIAAAKADVKLRTAELDELKNGTRKEDLVQARARVTRDKAEVEYRAWQAEKAVELFDRSSTTTADVKESRFSLAAAKGRLAESEAALRLLEEGPRKEKIVQAEAALEASRAVLAQLQEELAQHTVAAPFDGWVVSKRAEVGQWVGAGNAIAVVAALDVVEMVVPVPQDAVLGIRIGQKVEVDAVGRHPGEVAAIVPEADVRGRTFPVRIRMQNPVVDNLPKLKAGMLARVTLAVGKELPTLLVPKDAIVLGGPAPIVWVIDEKSGGGRIAPVTVGAGYGDKVGVTGPLKPGDRVVVRGNERLRPGQPLKIKD